jgi:hypothetical protein
MHCVRCGANSVGLAGCNECRTPSASGWLLAIAVMLWIAALAIDAVDRVLLYRQLERAFAALGAAPPAPARIYFAMAHWLRYPALVWALLAPLVIASRARKLDAWRWSRRYGCTAALAFVWAGLGLVLCYVAASALGPAI